jgi:aspartate/methionine/tyrosine aminotransferase
MQLPDFELERYFARWEFDAPYLLCASDAETFTLAELLERADDETAALWRELTLGYTESSGHPLLRAEIALLYEGLQADDVIVFAGAEEPIFAIATALLGAGDHAIVTWPAYQSLHEVPRAAGAEVTLLELEHDAGWALDPAAVRRALRPDTRLIAINFPHNPTGAMVDEATLREIADIAGDAGAVLLCDEVYRGLELDPGERLPAGADLYERALSLGVMSKAYGLAGLRIGWLATRDRALLDRIARIKDYTTICNSAPSEILALIALRAGDALLERNRGIVRHNLAELDRFFERWADVLEWVRPRAGTVGFPRLVDGTPARRLSDELLAEQGVLVAPGGVFQHPGEHFRLGFGRRNMPEALERLETYLAGRRVPATGVQ